MKKAILILLMLFPSFMILSAQDKENKEEEKEEASEPVLETFYGTRAINLNTVSQLGRNVLAYRISHRLGDIDGGGYNFWGIDGPASISLMVDYGILDNLMVGIGRNSLGKVYEGYAKWTFLQQTEDNRIPLSVGLFAKANMTGLRDEAADVNGFDRYDNFAHRMEYMTSLMIAYKWKFISIQVSPSYIHRNLVEGVEYENDIFAVSGMLSVKILKRLGLSAEFSQVLNQHVPESVESTYFNSVAFGVDIVTGGHIFQLHLINSIPVNDIQGIYNTRSDISDGKLRLGFNISRKFWF